MTTGLDVGVLRTGAVLTPVLLTAVQEPLTDAFDGVLALPCAR